MRGLYRAIAARLQNFLAAGPQDAAQTATIAHGTDQAVASYWTEHNVTLHRSFASAGESLEYFAWRNDQYFDYITLMPVDGQDGRIVLDYGCGPGNDLVGFATQSRPQKLIGMDVSASSLEEAASRLKLHGADIELHLLRPGDSQVPLPDASVDFIHCSGVLHHIKRPEETLAEFRRILRPGGRLQLMVYNRASLWMHLYCAYHIQILQGRYAGESLEEVFRKSTDGEKCPVSRAYRPDELVQLARQAGLALSLRGVAVSAYEMSLFESRYAAIMDARLSEESRKFLVSLQLDERGLATAGGVRAGVDACFSGEVAN